MGNFDLNDEELAVWRANSYSVKKIIGQLIAEREAMKNLHEQLRSKMTRVRGESFLDSPMVALEDIKEEEERPA